MAQTIKLKRTATTTKGPADAPSFAAGEMMMNTTDLKLWAKGDSAFEILTENSSIELLTDVNTMTPSNGQVLTWDNSNSRWDAEDAVGSTTDLDRVIYKYTATLNQTDFNVTYSDTDNIDVFVNGVLLNEDQYTPTTGTKVVLDVGSQTGDKVVVYYWDSGASRTKTLFTATASQTVFTVSYVNMLMSDVYVNGSLYQDDQYTLGGGDTLTFDTALQAGDKVVFYAWPSSATVVNSVSDADTLESHDGDYYLNWTYFTNTPTSLSGYGITTGILDTNAVVVDQTTTATSTEYARFTASGLESRSPTEVKTDLSLNNVENTAVSTWVGGTSLTTLGTIGTGTWEGTPIDDSYISSASTWDAKLSSSSSIEDLVDVNTMTPTDGQALIWDNDNSRWDVGTAAASIKDLTDVFTTMTPSDGQVLTWDNDNTRWDAAAGGGGGTITEIDGGVADTTYESTATTLDGGDASGS